MNDIALDENFRLLVKDGDFVIQESTRQHIALLLITEKGSWRTSPYTGIGIRRLINDDARDRAGMEKEINKQVSLDGAKVERLDLSGEAIDIKADYDR